MHKPFGAAKTRRRLCQPLGDLPLKYFLSIRTAPGDLLPLADVLLLRESMRAFLGDSDVHKLDGPGDADIDSDAVADMIAEGYFAESEFFTFCESFGVEPQTSDGGYHEMASQAFLQRIRGLEVMSLTLPADDSVADVYAAIIDFARSRNLRVFCPMPLFQGDIDLSDPGKLPPHWDHYSKP